MSIDEHVSPRTPRTSLAARAGRWSARHRKTAILGWLTFVVLATVLGGAVPRSDVPDSQSGNGESKRGAMIVDAAGYPEEAREQVLVQGRGAAARASDPAVVAAIRDASGAWSGSRASATSAARSWRATARAPSRPTAAPRS